MTDVNVGCGVAGAGHGGLRSALRRRAGGTVDVAGGLLVVVDSRDVVPLHALRPELAGGRAALSHLRVVVTGRGIAARYCGRLFARQGAAVTAVGAGDEGSVDLFTQWLLEGTSPAPSDAELDRRVDLVVLDTPAGPSPGPLPAVDGSTVVLSVSWFAPDGPHRDLAGSDEAIWAMSGVAYGIGEPDQAPVLPRGCAPQLLAGLNAFTAAQAALLEPADRRPASVQVDVHETMAMLVETAGVRALDGGPVRPRRFGVNRFGSTYPTTSYRCADGWVGLTCLTPAQWRATCTLIGREDLADDPRFTTSQGRLHHADEVDALIAPALAHRPSRRVVEEALALRLPLCPMPDPGSLPQHEHWRARGSFAPVGDGPALAPVSPLRMAFTGRPVPPWEADGGPGPLAGLRVADFTMGWAGPFATRLLADLGADVVKVEHDDHPDWWRGWDPPDGSDPPSTELQPHFNAMNRNKRGVCLDLRSPEDMARAQRLIAGADVVVENFAAGVMDGLGLGVDVQRRLNRDIISISLPPFGSTGPLASTRAYGTTVEQASGLPFVNGRHDWPPSLTHVALGDPISGMYACAATLVAIAARGRHGGSVVEVTQVEGLFQLCAPHIIEATSGRPARRTGNRRPGRVLSCVVASAEGDWVHVTVDDGRGWARLCHLLDVTQHADRPLAEADEAVVEVLEAALAAWLGSRSTRQGLDELRDAGAVAVAVRPPGEIGADDQHVACALWGSLERAHVGRHSMAHQPFRMDGRRLPLRRPAPLLGQHTTEVLAELDAATAPRSGTVTDAAHHPGGNR